MGNWSLDYMAGAAVLFGHRTLSISNGLTGDFLSEELRETRAVFNTDASLGISFAVASNTKLTLGYRVDAYFGALRNPSSTNIESIDYIEHGPFGRLTSRF
jgi:hypothetical protein